MLYFRIKKSDDAMTTHDNNVSVTIAGNTVRITICQSRNTNIQITKISKDQYVDRDGVLCDFNHNKSRKDSMTTLKKSLERGRDIINANCTDVRKCLFVTLTYRQRENENEKTNPMRETKKLYIDIDRYHKRFRYKYGKDVRFIICCEPQCSGSWHAHIIYIFPKPYPYISNDELSKMWGHGFVSVKRIREGITNVGAYLTSYLTSVDLDEFEEAFDGVDTSKFDTVDVQSEDESGKKIDKKIIKGARLGLYPPFFHPIRSSKNCIRPEEKVMSYDEAMELVEGWHMTFDCIVDVIDSEGKIVNKIRKTYYNKEAHNE